MSDFDKISIEKLDVDNYATWSTKMRFLLVSKGLWKPVSGVGVLEETQDQKALALIVMMMHITVHGRPVRPMGPVYTNRHEGGIKPAKNPTLVSPSASAPRP
jgi:hypothetical protein